MKKSYMLIAALCACITTIAQTISLTGGTQTENFNTLALTGTSSVVPTGWFFVETGTGANTTYAADPGTGNSGNTYSFGAAANTERAFGGIQSGTVVPTIGAGFTNNTGSAITTLQISYTGEQWRFGATGRADRLDFQYSTNATAINNGTWTDYDPLDFTSPNITAAVGALNGNAAGNFTLLNSTITGLSLAPGATIYIRWNDFNATGADDGLSVDDFSITPGSVASTTVSIAATANAAEPNTDGTFTVSLSSTSPTDVIVNYTIGGTATAGSDYTTLSGTVTIPANQSSATIIVDVLDDAIVEPTETVTVTLQSATAPYTIGTALASLDITSEDVGTISFTGNYSQDFNTLATSGTASTTPQGWVFSESGANANTTYTAGDGSSNAGNTYSFGTGTNAERAFGALRSSNLIPVLGGIFTNNTGITITSLRVTYTGEQWRLGTSGRNDRLDFQYSLNNSVINSGAFIDEDGLDFIAPNGTGTVGALNGNDPANSLVISSLINGLSIPPGQNFVIRWTDFDVTGAEDGLGVDDFTITLGCTPPTNQPTALDLTPALQSINGSFTPAAAGSTPADAYLVLVSASPALTEQPETGSVYAVDDVIGNARVVSITGTTFNATGLNPSTTYYFFVYSNSSITNCYTIPSPLTGNIATLSPPACTAPTESAGALNATNITGTSMDISWSFGNGDNTLVIAKAGSAPDAVIYNSLSYPVGTDLGGGNTVVYNGNLNSFSLSSLAQNTTYYFAIYEYSNAGPCYLQPAYVDSAKTLCVAPENITGLGLTAANASVNVTWTLPASACYDELIVVASTAPITTAGSTFTGPANSTYTSGEQIVYRGAGTGVTVTGLTNGTLYYFKVFTRKGTSYSSGVQGSAIPFDPASGYTYLYGNSHAHSSYSDGNKDDLSKIPADDFKFARDALCMDFLSMSEHNHAGAGMSKPNFALGFIQADTLNMVAGPSGHTMVTNWGMEWGVISNGGHSVVVGFGNKLIGWEAGNYDIFVAKSDYASLWTTINAQSGAYASLAHPNNADYTNLLSDAYNVAADDAIVGCAVESGPAFSTSTTYNDFPSQLAYLSYFKGLLAKGYHIGPVMDQDNHNMTFGTANSIRTVVLASSKSREGYLEGMHAMRFYASEDCDLRIDYKNDNNPMGSQVANAGRPSLSATITDPDGELTTSIELWGGVVGGAVPGAPLKTYNSTSTFSFTAADAQNTQADNSTWYYYIIITQEDGNKAVSAPIWYTRSDVILPLNLLTFTGSYEKAPNDVLLKWTTAQESNTREFIIERLIPGGSWQSIGVIAAAGNSVQARQYQFIDASPVKGKTQYRLRMVDIDGHFRRSPIVLISIDTDEHPYTISPNPVQGITYLRSTGTTSQLVSVSIIDYNGHSIHKGQYAIGLNTPVKLDFSGQAAGVYLVRIEGQDKVTTQKVVVY